MHTQTHNQDHTCCLTVIQCDPVMQPVFSTYNRPSLCSRHSTDGSQCSVILLQVANHMLGRRISKHVVGSNEDVTIIMDDSGSDSPHSTDSCEVDTSRHCLLDGNQTSDASDYAAETEKTGHNAPARGPSMRQSVQADGTLRVGHPSIHGRSGSHKAPLAGVEMSDMLKTESRVSSLGLGVTPSASVQDFAQLQPSHQTPAHGQSGVLGGRTGSGRQLPTSASFDDFGDTQRPEPVQNGSSVLPSPFSSPSPFLDTNQQDRAVPDPSAPVEALTAQAHHPLERSPSFQSGRITRWWGRFDAQYMQPVFGGPTPPLATDPRSDPAQAAHAVLDPHAPAYPGNGR